MKQKIINFIHFIRKQPRWRLVVGGGVLILICLWIFSGGKAVKEQITYTIKRGNLDITVLEGGSIEALEFQDIRSEVRGYQGVKILKIVDEGYIVTDDDVKNGKVLIELDSSDLRDKLVQQEINYQTALANLTDARQNYEIQRGQNTNDIRTAENAVLFARMDFEKYVGDKSATEIISILGLDKVEQAARKYLSGKDDEALMLAAIEKNDAQENADTNNSTPSPTNSITLVSLSATNNPGLKDLNSGVNLTPTNIPPDVKTNPIPAAQEPKKENSRPVIDYASYADPNKLGDGSAMQDVRKDMNDLQTAKQQFGLAETKLAGTKRLFAKGFATKNDLDVDQLGYDNWQLQVKSAETALNLYIKYEFIKQCRTFISTYETSLHTLDRTKKEAISKLAQARGRLKGAEGYFNLQVSQRKDLVDQIDKCTIKATKPGLVVYSAVNPWDNTGQIREGAIVRERQSIITIPNLSLMSVKVSIHESYIQKITNGLTAKIKIDAYPDRPLTGEVVKVGLLPDSQDRWLNPDLKVYKTSVSINATNDWIKPGMSAKVEILVKQLRNILSVPLQAVNEIDGKRYCTVIGIGKEEKREVTTGEFNDEFIEIKTGLKEGDKVSLRAPEIESKSSDDTNAADKAKAKTTAAPRQNP